MFDGQAFVVDRKLPLVLFFGAAHPLAYVFRAELDFFYFEPVAVVFLAVSDIHFCSL